MKCKWCSGKVKNNVCQACLMPQDADEKKVCRAGYRKGSCNKEKCGRKSCEIEKEWKEG